MWRAGRGAAPEHLARSCHRMALPAVALYLALAVPSRFGLAYSGTNGPDQSAHAGPGILLGAVVVAAWFLVLGFVAGRLVARRPPDPGPAVSARPPRLTRARLTAEVAALLAASVAVAVSGGGVATASEGSHVGDLGALGSFLLLGSVSIESSTASGSTGEVPVEKVTPVPPPGYSAAENLHRFAVAEETYYAVHGTYTADASKLDISSVGVGLGPPVHLVRAGRSSYCLESVSDTGVGYTYDSDVGTVSDGLTC
jgi:hypothetical protein